MLVRKIEFDEFKEELKNKFSYDALVSIYQYYKDKWIDTGYPIFYSREDIINDGQNIRHSERQEKQFIHII